MLRLALSLLVFFIIPQKLALSASYDIQGDLIGQIDHYKVQQGDNLYAIARRFDVGIVELLAANPDTDVWDPEEGADLTLPTMHILPPVAHEGIVINLSGLRLFYFVNEHTVLTFPVGIGKEGWRTPTGTTQVIRKRKNPAWIPPASIKAENPDLPDLILPGPDNPLGAYALDLGWSGFRIHGTNHPSGVGKRASHGCIRLYPEDIAVLYNSIKPGTPVTVVDEDYKLGWRQNTFWLQITPTQQQSDEIAQYDPPTSADIFGIHDVIEQLAGDSEIDWYAVDAAIKDRSGIPIAIAERK